MSDNQNGVPVTYVTDPPVAAGTTIVSGGSIAIAGQPIQVYVQGGTIGASFSFVGSVTTDIGNVKLEDADDNYAVIPPAQDLKTISTKALVVQTVDRVGRTISAGTVEAIMFNGSNANDLLANIDLNTMAATVYLAEIANTQGTQSTALLLTIANQQGTLATSANQTAELVELHAIHNNTGTLATSANQADSNAKLAAILTAQGTQSTAGLAQNNVLVSVDGHLGTLATSANQTDEIAKLAAILTAQGTQSTAGLALNNVLVQVMNNQGTLTPTTSSNQVQTATMNNQGTQATSALQTVGNSTLSSILTTLQTPSTGTNLEATLFSGVYTASNSPAVNVNGYTLHSVQHIITNGSVTVQTQTSLDGSNWNLEAVDTDSDLLRLTGACKFIRAVYASGNGTVTTLLNSAKATGGGNTPNGAGPAEATFSGSIAGTLGSTYTLPVNGATSVGFKLIRPTNATIIFEASWDGVNWIDITLRQMGAHGYSTQTKEDEAWIGSLSTFQFFRLRVTSGGTGIGTIIGKFSATMSTLEGIENANMPHRIGATVESRAFNYSAAVSNGTIWAPGSTDHRLYITDIHFTVDANTVVTFCDGSYAENRHIFTGAFKPASATSQYVPISFSLPHVFSGANRALMLTSTATANVQGVVHGYEAE